MIIRTRNKTPPSHKIAPDPVFPATAETIAPPTGGAAQIPSPSLHRMSLVAPTPNKIAHPQPGNGLLGDPHIKNKKITAIPLI